MKRLLSFALVFLGLSGISSAQEKGAAAFEKLHALAGNWEGTLVWSGARTGTGKLKAKYSITSYGSAIVEDLIMDGVPSMTSVYHMDGPDLRVTHFCGAQNQPRLKASAIDLDKGQVTFSFVDITNLRSPTAGHVHGLEIRFLDPNHITLRFLFTGDGKESEELIDLQRGK
jgi:hypothetical protein